MSTRLRLAALAAVLAGARCQLAEGGLADAAVVDVMSDVGAPDVTDASDAGDDVSDATPQNDGSVDAGFSPPDIAGLALWLRADLGLALQTGVATWADSSGSKDPNKSVTQISTAAQPSFNSTDNAYNGHATVGFSSSASQTLVSGKWLVPLNEPLSVFVVGNFDGSTATQMILSSQGNGVIEMFSNNGNVGFGIYAGGFVYGSATLSNAPQVYGAIFAGATSAVLQSAITPTGTGSVYPSYGFTELALGSVAGAKFLNGKVAEVTIYSGIVAGNDLAALMSYFGARYGLPIGP